MIKGFRDSNKWAKLQTFQAFGPFLHELYKKERKELVGPMKDLIKACYSNEHVSTDDMVKLNDSESFMNNNDEITKIKFNWAYNLPCAVMVQPDLWQSILQPVYEGLQKSE